jgi:hypothetical protein
MPDHESKHANAGGAVEYTKTGEIKEQINSLLSV